LTKEAYEDHMSKGLCYTCHEHGHMSRNCPKANVVKMARKDGKAPGMKIHSIALGLEENEGDMMEDEELTVMDSLPLHAMDFDDFYVSDDEPPALQLVSDSEDEDQPDLESVHNSSTRDAMEFPWIVSNPEKAARKQIGDMMAMKAEYVLARSQPYPGDEVWIAQDRGMIHRFEVTRKTAESYEIFDLHRNERVLVPTWRLAHPRFRLGRFYARHRAAQIDAQSIGSYGLTMGHAFEELTAHLLRDG
ncbi:hypothetical protein BKA70DRAFT_1026851, partial [Coprinopsis sp. MPI-PUGE-AT-0042]